jgi:ketosteroid isomerase-like protein
MSHEHVAVVKRVYERWTRGDFSVDPELMAADFVWHQRRGAVEPGSHSGGGIGRALERIFEVYDDFRIEPEEYLNAGEKVVVVTRSCGSARGKGMELDLRLTFLWTVRNGKLASMAQFADRGEALRAAGLA